MFFFPGQDTGREYALIETNFNVVINGEYPILYTGKNSVDGWVVGSFMEEDDDNLTLLRYIHFALKESDYFAFVSRKISYKDIFDLYKTAFIVERKLGTMNVVSVYAAAVESIDEDYIPHPESFYPLSQDKKTTMSYRLSLKGGVADAHHALSKDLAEIQTAFSKVLEESISELPDLGLGARVLQDAYSEGSFQLNFTVELNKGRNLFTQDDLLSKFQNDLLAYCLKHLPGEVDQIYLSDTLSEKSVALLEDIKAIYFLSSVDIPNDERIISSLKKMFASTADGFAKAVESVGKNYSVLDLYNKDYDGDIVAFIGRFDDESSRVFHGVVDRIKQITSTPEEVDEDMEFIRYKVYIYNLNAKTRVGTGNILEEDGVTVHTPQLKINGNDALEKTIFTESLDQHKFINVMAKATRNGGKIRRLLIDFESTKNLPN